MDDLTKVIFKTSMGDITIALYDNTPLHKENFLKLVKENYYDGVLFHRIIQGFMIQTGDPDSKGAPAGKMLGNGGPDYTIPAEFRAENYHKRGAVAAARQGDQVNPTKASSGSQFYIVDGKPFTKDQLNQITMAYGTSFTDEQTEIYTTVGGAPFLDMQYTVFGEVVEGMDVVDKIAAQKKDRYDRPFNDIKIISTTIVENEE
ncbi:MAG: peptidylprolyl isomerase [Bacteroidales bacterium]|nr:peptidylprolyl isomerase [Bacteroidales bacterium]MBR4487067.1 peptidylprolyl isomerase [Bacteroidales bacterium]